MILVNAIDVVISDIRMPDGDGISILTSLRARNATKPVVILVTGYADHTAEECLKRGAKFVIQKPYDREELMSALNACLKRGG